MTVSFSEQQLEAALRNGARLESPSPVARRPGKPKNAAEVAARKQAPRPAVRGAGGAAPQKAAPTTPRPQKPAQKPAQQAKGTKKKSKQIDYADLWLDLMRVHAPDLLQGHTHELRFAETLPEPWKRQFRFDHAWPVDAANPWAGGVAVEVDGGHMAFGGGRHGSDEDRVKLNLAALLGWQVLRFSPQQLKKDPLTCFHIVRAALAWRPGLTAETAHPLPEAWREEERKKAALLEMAAKEERERKRKLREEQGLRPARKPARRPVKKGG
jgi:hypothetical protein